MRNLLQLRTLLIIGSLVVVMSMLVAACGDDDDDDDGTNGDNGSEEVENGDDENGDDDQAADPGDFEGTIDFGDYGWDSAIVHNRIAQYVLENGWGYETDSTTGETISLFQGLVDGDVDVSMEIWVDQQPQFEPEVEDGTILDLGANYPESVQGWYVPTYMIEGDEERGIEPMTPDLEHVDDLPEYVDVFEDPEDPEKGRFYDCIAGWECQRVNESKFEYYGLDEHYNRFQPGSGAALATSLVSAYEQGEPWLGYYWAPTWVFAQVELTMLEEPEYTDECWDDIVTEEGEPTGETGCAYPSVQVNKSINAETAEQLPEEVLTFLEEYETTMDQNNEFLLYMQENEIDEHEVAAIWFLKEHEDLWTEWVPEDVAEDVLAALEEEDIP
ncbi:MAG: ABC transporter substrate-binding protein [Chloroflexota bacterium]